MKRFIKTTGWLAMAAAIIFGTAACSSSDDSIAEQQPANPTAQKTYTMTVSATKGGDETRALNLDGNTLNATWATTEHVYVKKGETWATGSLNPQTAGASTTLKGTLSGVTFEASDGITLQFPKSGDITYAGQKGTLADIAENFDWATATATNANVEDGKITVDGNVTFVNQQAIVKFTLVDKANTSTMLSPTALTINDGTSDIVTLTGIPDATYTTNGAGVLYVALPAVSSKPITLTATVGSDTYTLTTSGNKSFANGSYYRVTAKMEKQVTDLSMVDNAGAARSTMSTANCYMVHTAGDYKLPLVYGNAIKDGAANTAAYTGIENEETTLTFPNHAGTAINAPWITKATTGEGVAKGMGITVVSAELLWQDAQGLITAVGISGDYLTLTVGKDATTQQGNAVVAAKTSDGTIVWSWHIWVTTETFATLTTVATGDHTYSVTPVNLGWVPTDGDGKQGYAPYYQWGRKDAFIPSDGATFTFPFANRTVYDISNAPVTGLTYTPSTTAAIADNIKNPTTFYKNSNTFGPCDTKYYNMWDAQQMGTGNIATATKKTVYDPCPAGFCVPTGNLYYFMGGNTMTTWDDTNKGATWSISITGNALFFPASGCRSDDSGMLDAVGFNGYYWSASPYSSNFSNSGHSHYLNFYSGFWVWDSYERATGFPVRAVKE